MLDPASILAHYAAQFAHTWADCLPVGRVRFVSFDSETTGLNPKRDALVSLGAIAVQGGEILLDETFEEVLKVQYNNAMVVIHGITREESLKGRDEDEALLDFLNYLGDAVIVGHHIGYDIAMLNEALQRHFGLTLRNRTLDTMDLALHLERTGLLPLEGIEPNYSLDALCARFGIAPHDRHTAHGDAFLTAQVFLKLLRLATKAGRTTLGSVCEAYPLSKTNAPFSPAGG
jgi:DNA polymerase-3 subunit epsilon